MGNGQEEVDGSVGCQDLQGDEMDASVTQATGLRATT